ncbi:DegT/DnrJ/EryC1/StrS family aminotransferase [Alphaproteobacteria bacterium]|nr:DegT/DnrJ/EryC1/StrS family aminotransferase [Alphaproteobacteria bacterium]
MNIPAKPFLNINLFKRTLPKLDEFGLLYLNSGTAAVLKALMILDPEKKCTIILPALICATVPQAIKDAGFKIFYVDSQIHSIWPSLESYSNCLKADGSYIIVLIEFFGAEVPYFGKLERMCKAFNCRFIIDRCHSCLTRANYDEQVDAIARSYRKTLPLPSIGSVETRCKFEKIEVSKISFKSVKFFVSQLCYDVLFRVFKNKMSLYPMVDFLKRIKVRRYGHPRFTNKNTHKLKYVDYFFKDIVSNSLYLDKCKEVRKYNLVCYQNGLEMYDCPVEFSNSNVPQVYPISARSNDIRGKVDYAPELRKMGIGAFNWPGEELPFDVINNPSLPNALVWSSNVVCLPLHQSIHPSDLRTIIQAVKSLRLSG